MAKITKEQIFEILAQDRDGRVTKKSLQVFLQNPDRFLEKEAKEKKQAIDGLQCYPVSVDYGMSLSEMIAAGRYDYVNSDINDRNFPQSGIGKASMEAFLVHLNKYATTQEVLDYLESQGMRPATLPELLAFGAENPEIQRKFPVVCVGSSRVSPRGSRDIPYLSSNGSERDLGLNWDVSGWGDVCRFLAVRK